MDGKRFDDLSRRLSRVTTRRGALKAALAVIFAGAGGAVTTERVGAVATIRRNMCRKPGAGCSRNVQCCSGLCDTRRSLPRSERNRCVCIPACEGKVCGPSGCSGGVCGVCNTGESCCNGGEYCANLQADETNCGTCGNVCANGETCCAGVCKNLSTDEANCGACGVSCGAGETCCGGEECANLSTDVDNCGACGTVCDSVNGESCCFGECANIDESEAHCGTCGDSCGAGETCCAGECVDLLTDEDNCGECGNDCRTDYSCTAGVCSCAGTQCPSGQTCCTDVCADLNTSMDHCLTCGNACDADMEVCIRKYRLGCTSICNQEVNGFGFGSYDQSMNFRSGFNVMPQARSYTQPINPNGDYVDPSTWTTCTANSDCSNCPATVTTELGTYNGLECGCNKIFCLGGSPSDFPANGHCVVYVPPR